MRDFRAVASSYFWVPPFAFIGLTYLIYEIYVRIPVLPKSGKNDIIIVIKRRKE